MRDASACLREGRSGRVVGTLLSRCLQDLRVAVREEEDAGGGEVAGRRRVLMGLECVYAARVVGGGVQQEEADHADQNEADEGALEGAQASCE